MASVGGRRAWHRQPLRQAVVGGRRGSGDGGGSVVVIDPPSSTSSSSGASSGGVEARGHDGEGCSDAIPPDPAAMAVLA